MFNLYKEIIMKKANQVYVTNDYSMFKFIKGNRDVNLLHAERLKKSMRIKYIPVPIIINEHNEIIDGQHRFTALKDLNMPVHYIIEKGLGLSDVQRLNTNSANWTPDEYMKSYCDLGLKEYIKYREFKNEYGLCHSDTQALLTGSSVGGGQGNAFNDGHFKITHLKQATEIAKKICAASAFYDGYAKQAFVKSMQICFANPDYKHDEFLKRFKNQSYKLLGRTTYIDVLPVLEEIYNYKRPQLEKVRLTVL